MNGRLCKAPINSDLVMSSIQDELSPDSVVLRAAVVKQRIGEIGHPFAAEAVSAAEEHGVLQTHGRKNEGENEARMENLVIFSDKHKIEN